MKDKMDIHYEKGGNTIIIIDNFVIKIRNRTKISIKMI